jgi:hypothetical protein
MGIDQLELDDGARHRRHFVAVSSGVSMVSQGTAIIWVTSERGLLLSHRRL